MITKKELKKIRKELERKGFRKNRKKEKKPKPEKTKKAWFGLLKLKY